MRTKLLILSAVLLLSQSAWSQTAPWRITRSKLNSDMSTSSRDAHCKKEFGASYVLGTSLECNGLTGINCGNETVTLESNRSKTEVYGGVLYPLFCIKK